MKRKIMAWLLAVCLFIPSDMVFAGQETEAMENVSQVLALDEDVKTSADVEVAGEQSDVKAATTSANISVNTSYTGQLLEYDDVRTYHFTLTSAGMVNITFTHGHIMNKSRYWVICIYNDKKECVMQMDSAGTETDRTSVDVGLAAGNYYVKVNSDEYERYGDNYSAETYTLRVNYTASEEWERENNDSFSNANVVDVNRTYSGANQFYDDVDRYNFVLTSAGMVNITFTHAHIMNTSRYWVIRIYNDRQECVMQMDSAGTETDKTSVDVGLAAGNYYVKVNSDDYEQYEDNYSAKTYTLRVNYTASEDWERENNDSFSNADVVEVNRAYSGANQFYDDKDYYKFTLTEDGKISINFQHPAIVARGRYWVVRVYNANTDLVVNTDIYAENTETNSINVGLPAGDYYIKVNSDDYEDYKDNYSKQTYTIKVNYTQSSTWETEKNNSYATADTIEIGTEHYAAIQFTNDLDYYKFTVNNAGNYNIAFKHEKISNTGRYWVAHLYNDNTRQLTSFDITGTETTTYSGFVYLEKGIYYLRINSGYYENSYNDRASGIDYKFKVDYALKDCTAGFTSVKDTSNNKIKLTWYAFTEADGYIVYRSTSKNGTYKAIKTIKGTSKCTYTDSSVKTGTKYYYKVRAYKTVNGEKIHSRYSAVKSITAKPASVSLKSVKAGKKKATVTWKKQSGVSGYEVYMSAKKSSGYKKVKTISKLSTVKYTKTGLKKGKTYYFKVRSYKIVKGKKVYGEFSKVKSVKVR